MTLLVLPLLALTTASTPAPDPAGAPRPLPWITGAPELASIGQLAFGPDGVLFVADPLGARIHAVRTEAAEATAPEPFVIEAPEQELAALFGSTPDRVAIHDLAVHPASGDLYLSVTHMGSTDRPALVRVDPYGEFALVPLEDVTFMSQSLDAAPVAAPEAGARNPRLMSITDLALVDGRLYVAGLSNEEFASSLRSLAFPFVEEEGAGNEERTSIEIFHGNHGVYETHAPIRTFLPYEIDGAPSLVAAYTCTPLVTFRLADLEPGTRVRGHTVAELGGGNRPLDMVAYEKDGESWLLISNSRRGVMKVRAADLGTATGIDEPVAGTAGVGYETLAELEGVSHMTSAGEDMIAVIIVEPGTTVSMLATIELP